MKNRTRLTVAAVVAVATVLAGIFLLLNDQGVAAEVVRASPEAQGVLLCAPAGLRLGTNPDAPARAFVRITESTELLDQRKRSPSRFRAADLQPGQRVRLWTDGRMLLSEPPQLTATRLSLLADPATDRPSSCAP
jgi:hypothetical protein